MSFEVADEQPTPFDRFAKRRGPGAVIAAALLQLDTLYREVLVLRFHEELSLDEIAKVTRAPLSTVKSRLYRGLAAIKPKLERANLRRQEVRGMTSGMSVTECGPQSRRTDARPRSECSKRWQADERTGNAQ